MNRIRQFWINKMFNKPIIIAAILLTILFLATIYEIAILRNEIITLRGELKTTDSKINTMQQALFQDM